jgi:Protein of unknown function (DUF3887)
MFKTRTAFVRSFVAAAVATLTLSAAACGEGAEVEAPVTAEVSLDEARAIAAEVLAAFNDGDYAAFSRRWSDSLRQQIPEPAFQAFRANALARYGKFVRFIDPRGVGAQHGAIVRYTFRCEFERGPLALNLGFPLDGDRLVAVYTE